MAIEDTKRTLDVVSTVLMIGFVCTMIFLLAWFVMVWIAGDWMYEFHSSIVSPMERESFNHLQYQGMAYTKVLGFMLFLFPWIGVKIAKARLG